MKVLILSGFLGSGKTTALLKLAHYIVEHSESDSKYKIVILENEVGEVGIDDKLLRSDGYDVENLFSGCACCSLAGELISSVKKIKKDMDPDWLVLETTGVAYPNNIRKKLKEYTGIDAKICTVVDAKRWKRLLIPLHNLLEGQMEGADSVLINKINLVDEETVNNVAEDVRGLCNNEQVIVHKINALEPIEEEVWEGIL